MRNKNIFSVVISVSFLLFLLVPMTVPVFRGTENISRMEKRKLAPFPKIEFSAEGVRLFPDGFEKYVNDHFGFRSTIVRAHNYTLCKYFGVSPNSMVTIGSDNWFFFNADGAIYDYRGKFVYSDYQLEKVTRLLEDRAEWLESFGVQYLFLPVPNKEPIYEEFLPRAIREDRGRSKYEQIVGYLKDKSTFDSFVDVQKLMLENKDKMRLFLQTDGHWNNDGAFLVYREMEKRFAKLLPGTISPLKSIVPGKMIENFSGDLSTLMNLEGLVTETAPDINVERNCNLTEIARMQRVRDIPAYRDIQPAYLPVSGGCPEREDKVLVIHDSFGLFLRFYFLEQFREVIFVNHMNFEKAKLLIEKEKPDVVIDQRVGRNLEKALLPDPKLENMVLRNKFPALSKETMSLDGPKVSNYRTASPLGYRIPLSNPGGTMSSSAARLKLTGKKDMVLVICNRPMEQGSRCQNRPVTKGKNELYFRVIQPIEETVLELSVLDGSDFTIDSFTVKIEGVRP